MERKEGSSGCGKERKRENKKKRISDKKREKERKKVRITRQKTEEN